MPNPLTPMKAPENTTVKGKYEHLQLGDKVIIKPHAGGSRVASVDRLTPTLICIGSMTFRRDTGMERSSSSYYHKAQLEEYSQEGEQAIEDAKELQQLRWHLDGVKWRHVDLATARRVMAALKDLTAREKGAARE